MFPIKVRLTVFPSEAVQPGVLEMEARDCSDLLPGCAFVVLPASPGFKDKYLNTCCAIYNTRRLKRHFPGDRGFPRHFLKQREGLGLLSPPREAALDTVASCIPDHFQEGRYGPCLLGKCNTQQFKINVSHVVVCVCERQTFLFRKGLSKCPSKS